MTTATLRRAVVALCALTLVASACGDDGSTAATTAAPAAPVDTMPPGVTQLTPEEGADLIAKQGDALTIIDVRTPDEFATGHLEGAVNFDIEGGDFSKDIADLPKDAAYVVYCHSGRRALIAVTAMSQAGFTDVYDLGGIADWVAAGLPVVTD